MEYIFLFVSLYILIFLFPWYISIYTEEKLKCYLVMFGFIRVPIDLKRIYLTFTTRKDDQARDFDILEVVENYKKLLSTKPIHQDLAKRAKVNRFYWYTSVPMENPLLGLSMLPIYTIAQSVVVDTLYDNFKKVKDVDINTKYNPINNDVFIYFECIIKINLAKIIIVSVKYLNKMPILLKRVK